MTKAQKWIIFLLRVGMGWIFFYAGITKVLNPQWSAEMFLKGAKTFAPFYQSLTQPGILPAINFINEWGLTLLGISLILGIGVRLSSILGVVLMALYYFPQLNFPYVGRNAFIVDEHIVFILILVYFAVIKAGRIYGLEDWCANLPLCKNVPNLRSWFG